MAHNDRRNPLMMVHPAVAMHEAFERFGKHVQGNLTQCQQGLEKPIREINTSVARFVNYVQQQLAAHLQPVHTAQAAFASMTAGVSAHTSRAQPMFDLAFNPEEVKKRLSAVPVYAVVNNKNEFVLVTGDDGIRQLGMFFFNKEDAEGFIATIKEQNPKLGKSAKVLTTSMDSVYEFAVTPRENTDTEGVVFRFMPDAHQVENALELYRSAGLAAPAFAGVPLFQAEGLTVRGNGTRFTPLFFSKDDLDAALGDAYMARDSEAQMDARSKAERAREELAAAEAEAAGASDAKTKKAAQKKAEVAKKRVEQYEQRLQEATAKKKLPRVDVGSLEEVIVKMEADTKGEWGDVMFVPAGALQSGTVPGK